MGVVYLAEQEEPIRRRVAVKVIKRGMDSREVIARFERERQALALMSHPGIARVFDAGTSGEGLPFFVMELVSGIPITEYCDRNRLDARGRLELFVQVCEAVQHAHQKGIIHRDIKPTNVLVTVDEGQPRPKVIDFGVARAINQRLTERTLFTAFGVMVGTPGYMSPEQAEMTGLDIDTRTDIYSLGVLLYELLVGALPFDPKRLRDAGYAEMQRIIREEEPPKPSTRVSGLGATATEVARRRQTDAATLERQLRGDLDWIALKAIEKDRTRRYQSATELAADVKHHLSDEPVAAGPPSAAYRFRKLVRRHRAFFAAAAAVFVALLIGVMVSTAQYFRAETARKETRQQLVQLYVHTGMRLVEAGDLLSSLSWLVQALKLEEGGEKQREAHRLRIGSVLDQCPKLVRLWPLEEWEGAFLRVYHAVFSPDGRFVATASPGHTARVWDVATDESVTPPLGHGGWINSVEFSPESRRVVTASEDHTARLWDIATGRSLAVLQHSLAVRHAGFSHDGNRLVTASRDGTARVWDATTGRAISTMSHGGELYYAEFSPDDRYVLTAGGDGTARLWNAETGQPGPVLKHDWIVSFAEFSPDGKRIATASYDWTARVWDAATGKPVTPPLRHGSRVFDVRFSPDGRWIVTSVEDGTARLWDAATGQAVVVPLKHNGNVNRASFSPDGRLIATCTADGKAQLWRAATGEPLNPPLRHAGLIYDVRFDSTGRFLLTAGGDGTARLWDLSAGEPANPTLRHSSWVRSVEFSRDGRRLVTGEGASAVKEGYAQVWDTSTGAPMTPPLRHGSAVEMAKLSPDAGRVATAGWDGTARIWDAVTGEPLVAPISPGQAAVRFAAFAPDGRRLSTASTEYWKEARGTARIWDVTTGQPLTPPIQHRLGVRVASFSPDGRRIVTGSEDGTARVWDASTGKPITPPLKHAGGVETASFSPDGSRVVTGATDNTARVWDAATGDPAIPALKHGDTVAAASFNADGRQLLTASWDGTARIWSSATGEPLTPPLDHPGSLVTASAASFSPDGRWVLTACDDGAARVWDAKTGLPATPAFRHRPRQRIWSASFAPDGRRFATASQDTTARIWDLHFEKRPIEDLELLAEVLAGHRLEKTTGLVRLNGTELERAWRTLLRRNPESISVPAEKVEAWHRRQSEELAGEGRWSEALTHLDEMARIAPKRPRMLIARGEAHAELSRWKEAIADFHEALELRPDDVEVSYQLALLRLTTRDVQGWREACSTLLSRYGQTGNPDRARWVAQTCALSNQAGPAMQSQAVNLAEIALTVQPNNPDSLRVLGAAQYRAGEHQKAAETLKRAVEAASEQSDARTRLLLAMVEQKLENRVQLNRWLKGGREVTFYRVGRKSEPVAPPSWRERVELQLLEREARV